jgi:hypothetical protein
MTTRSPWYKLHLPVLLASVLLVTACGGDSVGNDGSLVGGACRDSEDCASDSFCVRGGDFPGGTCTLECRDDRDCPAGTACIDKEGGICLLLCDFDTDCRRDYDCKAQDRRGHSGDASVCID